MFFKGSLQAGKSKVTRVTVCRDTDQSFRVCHVNLATPKVAMTPNMQNKRATHDSLLPEAKDCARPAPSSVRLTVSAMADGGLVGWIAQRSTLTWDLV